MHQSQMIKLFEDGVAWLVDGEDHSLTSSGQAGHTRAFVYIHIVTENTKDTKTTVDGEYAADLRGINNACSNLNNG